MERIVVNLIVEGEDEPAQRLVDRRAVEGELFDLAGDGQLRGSCSARVRSAIQLAFCFKKSR